MGLFEPFLDSFPQTYRNVYKKETENEIDKNKLRLKEVFKGIERIYESRQSFNSARRFLKLSKKNVPQ
ncbi:hypothetical protein DLM75_06775 [Leptospira stimsonii]|uniref:Uncharacterized protein n=1 Tax=Leptospira stimsonii TaxID=2202203 RepID=A0A396ZB81_9LEPT|nr:hypothetical protein DLM75_06775 [Leptospira stimsonii]